MTDASQDYLLNHRVHYRQLVGQYRSGIEPVILAAAVPAKPGQHVLELGTGAGAGLLCLAARVPDIGGVGVDIQPKMVDLARQNLHSNGFGSKFRIIADDAANLKLPEHFEHAFANPPWHKEVSTASPMEGRDLARRSRATLLTAWTQVIARHLVNRGTLTLILPASALQDGVLALAGHGFGGICLLPLWPKFNREAKIILIQAVRGSFGPCRVLPGLMLHQPSGQFTSEAEAILRDGHALTLGPATSRPQSII